MVVWHLWKACQAPSSRTTKVSLFSSIMLQSKSSTSSVAAENGSSPVDCLGPPAGCVVSTVTGVVPPVAGWVPPVDGGVTPANCELPLADGRGPPVDCVGNPVDLLWRVSATGGPARPSTRHIKKSLSAKMA